MNASVGAIAGRLVLCAGLFAVTRPAWSASQFGANVSWQEKVRDQINGGFLSTDGDSAGQIDAQSASASISANIPDPPGGEDFHSFVGEATAVGGSMGAKSFLHLASKHDYGQQAVGFELESVAGSGLTVDDLVFTGPSGATSVATRLRLSVDGFVTARFARTLGGTIFLAGAGVSARLGDQTLAAFDVSQAGAPFAPAGVDVHSEHATIPPDAETLTTGVSGSFVTREVTVPLGVPQILQLSLMTRGVATVPRVEGMSDFDIQLTSYFSSTLWLPSSGPIFDLPDGYSVSSASGLIVDNRLGGSINTTTTTSTTSTTLPAGECDGVPAAPSFRSIGCRLAILLARVDTESGLGRFQAKLAHTFDRARTRHDEATRFCAGADAKKGRQGLKQVIRAIIQYGHRLRSPAARKQLDPTLRASLLAQGQAILADVKTLRAGVRCPDDAPGG